MHPRANPALPDLPPFFRLSNPRSARQTPRPIPDTTTLTTLNIGPTPDLIFTPGLKWIIQSNVKLHSHQTPDQPPLIPDQFLWLGRVWSGKKLPALIEECIYPRSTPAVPALYPWCTHAQIPLFPTYTRPSGWPIPALYDLPPTYSWCKYAHYAQYRTNPRSDFYSRPKMKYNNAKRSIPAPSQAYFNISPLWPWPLTSDLENQ